MALDRSGTGSGLPSVVHRVGGSVTRLLRRPPILMYHGVGRPEVDRGGLFVSPERFREQMAALHRCGLRGVSVADLGDAVRAGTAGGLVGISFDDGYRDVLRHALPVLAENGFGGTVYVVAGRLGGQNDWDPPPRLDLVGADDVVAVAGQGFEVGSHGTSHAHLPALSDAELLDEVAGSRTALAALTGRPPRTFCYPFGEADARVWSAVAAAGYDFACSVGPLPGAPPDLALSRIGTGEHDHALRLLARLVVVGRRHPRGVSLA